MSFQVDFPPSTAAKEALYSYLYQMAEQLNAALGQTQGNALTESQTERVASIAEEKVGKAAAAQAQALKSLIIKTASTITATIDELETVLRTDYLAVSDFGTFQEELDNQIRATAEGVVQSFNYDSRLEALQQGMVEFETFETSTNQYIKTGLLFFDDQGVPRYGVAVGEKLTTVTVDGEKVLTRTDLMSTFTSDRLSFWQGGIEVAYLSSGMLVIANAEVKGRLKIGAYSIKTMADGSMGIVYDGGGAVWQLPR
jgi:hypothetical protein